MSEARIGIYGSTGDIERDGILSAEQQELLNGIQNEAADVLLESLGSRSLNDKFPMAAMATGIGKTRIEHLAIERTKRKNPKAKILFIAGTKLTLVEQSSQNLRDYVESEDLEDFTEDDLDNLINDEQTNSGFYSVGKFGKDKDADVQIGTIQGVQSAYKNGRFSPDDFDLVVVDEAHNMGTPARKELIGQFKNVLAFTATPRRSSGKMREPEQYEFEVKYSLPLPEAQEKRLLPPLIGMQLNTSELVDEIPTNLNGQIDFKKLELILKDSPDLRPFIAEKVAKIIKDGDKEYKTVMVVNFVWEAEELAQLLKEKGISVGVAVNQAAAKRIHSEDIPATDSIERYKLPKGDPKSLQVLISPYVASEGFDAPATEVLVWASPTDSDLRYTQYNGRLARRFPGKAFGVVVDCLYQTSQYGWNLNFAMWMKDSVRQLPNGLLYLGPERDIEGLINLDAVKKMREESDKFNSSDLGRGQLEEIKETDFPITQIALTANFRGTYPELLIKARGVLSEIMKGDHDVVVRRRNKTAIVSVVSNKDLFIQKMIDKGVMLKGENEVRDSDFAITVGALTAVFIGNYTQTRELAQVIIEELKETNPELIGTRASGSQNILVVTDRDLFTQKMLDRGARLIPEIREEDNFFPITQSELRSVFLGAYRRIKAIANEVVEEIKISDSALVSVGKSGTQYVTTVRNRDLFIQKMFEKGVDLKQDVIELSDSDFPITHDHLLKLFKGKTAEIKALAQEVIEQMQKVDPNRVLRRKKGSQTVSAVTDRDLFINQMLLKGAIMRTSTSRGQEIATDDEFLIRQHSLIPTFVGDYRRIKAIADEVVEEIRSTNPELVKNRKSGVFSVIAVQKDVFIQKMMERGVRLKQ